MSANHWSNAIITESLAQFQRGATRVTVYLTPDRFYLETTTPSPGRPGYLIHFHADTLFALPKPSIHNTLKARLSSRIKRGLITIKPTPQTNGD